MRLCSPVVLSYWDAGFEPRCGRKDFSSACCCCCLLLAACCLLLLKRVAQPWTLKGGVKPRQGKPGSVNSGVKPPQGLPSSVINQDSRLGPSWVLVLVNALEITVEQSPLALQMFLHGQDDRPETWLKNGLFSPPNRPPCGTTAWHTPYSPPICIPLMAQSLWKSNGPHLKHLSGRPTIVLSFQDDHSENSPKTAIFGH